MNKKKHIILTMLAVLLSCGSVFAQIAEKRYPGKLQTCEVVKGDTIVTVTLKGVYCFPPRKFKNHRQEQLYWRDVRDVKKTLPLAKLIKGIMLETYEYLETLPNDKARSAHLKKMQTDLFEEYKPTLKQLNFRQGKLLVRLIDRECRSSSYTILQAYLGSFAAGFWQGFGKLFGVSLKSEWDAEGKDKDLEHICRLVEYGMI